MTLTTIIGLLSVAGLVIMGLLLALYIKQKKKCANQRLARINNLRRRIALREQERALAGYDEF